MRRSSTATIALGAALLGFVLLLAIAVAVDEVETGGGLTGGNGGTLNPGAVPAAFVPWLQRAGALCPQISAPLLAAQLNQESQFNPAATSPAGAEGPAQFLPSTWPAWGRDDDGTGRADPRDIGDAVMAQGRYMCALATQMAQAIAGGRAQGSVQDLALGAYNAGPGGVLAAGGVPHNGETDSYVSRIDASIPRYGTLAGTSPAAPAAPGAPAAGAPGLDDDAAFGANVITAARHWVGQPYVWGGGDANGPTGGGFDCSGLALNAVYAASGGRIQLPHNAAAQAAMGTPVAGNALRPGDLLFFSDSPGAPPHHVGIYLGGTSMLDAPDFGKTVQVSTLDSPYYRQQTITARRYA